MIQLSIQPQPGIVPGVRAAGFPLGTTSDFALAFADLAGGQAGIVTPSAPPGMPPAVPGDAVGLRLVFASGDASVGKDLPDGTAVTAVTPVATLPRSAVDPMPWTTAADERLSVAVGAVDAVGTGWYRGDPARPDLSEASEIAALVTGGMPHPTAPAVEQASSPTPAIADPIIVVPDVLTPPIAAVVVPATVEPAPVVLVPPVPDRPVSTPALTMRVPIVADMSGDGVSRPVEPLVHGGGEGRRATLPRRSGDTDVPTPGPLAVAVGLSAPPLIADPAPTDAPAGRTTTSIEMPAGPAAAADVTVTPPPVVSAPSPDTVSSPVSNPGPTRGQVVGRTSPTEAPRRDLGMAVVTTSPGVPTPVLAAPDSADASRPPRRTVAPLAAVATAVPTPDIGASITDVAPAKIPTGVQSAAPAIVIPQQPVRPNRSDHAATSSVARTPTAVAAPAVTAAPSVASNPLQAAPPVSAVAAPMAAAPAIVPSIPAPVTTAIPAMPTLAPRDGLATVVTPAAADRIARAFTPVSTAARAMVPAGPATPAVAAAAPTIAPLDLSPPTAVAPTVTPGAVAVQPDTPVVPLPIADRAGSAPVKVTVVAAVTPAQVPQVQPVPQLQPAAQAFAAAMFAAATPVEPREDDGGDALPLTIVAGLSPAAPHLPTHAVAATGQGQQPTLDMTKGDWMASMIDHIETLRDDSGGIRETRMKLAPEALGGVEVSVRRDDSGAIQVRIAADTPQARALLAEAAPKLAEMAEARGVKLGGASVDSHGQSADPGKRDAPSPVVRNRPASAVIATEDTSTDTRLA